MQYNSYLSHMHMIASRISTKDNLKYCAGKMHVGYMWHFTQRTWSSQSSGTHGALEPFLHRYQGQLHADSHKTLFSARTWPSLSLYVLPPSPESVRVPAGVALPFQMLMFVSSFANLPLASAFCLPDFVKSPIYNYLLLYSPSLWVYTVKNCICLHFCGVLGGRISTGSPVG